MSFKKDNSIDLVQYLKQDSLNLALFMDFLLFTKILLDKTVKRSRIFLFEQDEKVGKKRCRN